LLASGGVIPASIAQWLRPYQVEGVEHMYRLWKEGRGGILGDDMGLGSNTPPTFADLHRNGASYRIPDSGIRQKGELDRSKTNAFSTRSRLTIPPNPNHLPRKCNVKLGA
jgi:hypothetical protein